MSGLAGIRADGLGAEPEDAALLDKPALTAASDRAYARRRP